jgi:hypothetical protein
MPEAIAGRLERLNYEGYIGLECFPSGGSEAAVRAFVKAGQDVGMAGPNGFISVLNIHSIIILLTTGALGITIIPMGCFIKAYSYPHHFWGWALLIGKGRMRF